jgi:N-glycosylase/DNA lyase
MRIRLDASPLDLDQTLGCGQTFRWSRRHDGVWTGVIGPRQVELMSDGRTLSVAASPGGICARDAVTEYLRLADDIHEIQASLGSDPDLAQGLPRVRGLRLVKMDEWECLVSYILATYANIPRISKMIAALSAAFGKEIADGVYAFPSREELRDARLDELRACGLGYRAEYVRSVAQEVDAGEIGRLRRLGYEDLRGELKRLDGVGDKVADCVSLFGFGKLEAFPIDVWIERAMRRLYGLEGSYASLRRTAGEMFGRYAGYAQEYLYLNERGLAAGDRCMFSE